MSSSRCGILVGVLVLLAACGGGSGGEGEESEEGSADGPPSANCGTETLPTYLIIEGEDDLEVLDGVRVIEGELQINRTSFTDLDFLGCIEEVHGELTIFGNAELTDLSGLDRLQRLGNGFVFSENTAITDLAGLGSLTQIGDIVEVEVDGMLVEQPRGSLVIQGNHAMTGISGMTSLSTIYGALNIRDNDALEHIDGLRGLRTLGTQFAITHNPSLCISSVNQVGAGITDPAEPRDDWSARANDDSC
jgi:hypothetical protein